MHTHTYGYDGAGVHQPNLVKCGLIDRIVHNPKSLPVHLNALEDVGPTHFRKDLECHRTLYIFTCAQSQINKLKRTN